MSVNLTSLPLPATKLEVAGYLAAAAVGASLAIVTFITGKPQRVVALLDSMEDDETGADSPVASTEPTPAVTGLADTSTAPATGTQSQKAQL